LSTGSAWGYEQSKSIGQKRFFFEKKKQKTFIRWGLAQRPVRLRPKRTKVFWFFFSKKNCFLSGCRRHRRRQPVATSGGLRGVMLDVRLVGFLGMVLGVQRVAGGGVRMLGGIARVALAMLVGRMTVMLRGMLVMLGGFFVVVGDHCRVFHVALLFGGPFVRATDLGAIRQACPPRAMIVR
jgi:hypothetical protein